MNKENTVPFPWQESFAGVQRRNLMRKKLIVIAAAAILSIACAAIVYACTHERTVKKPMRVSVIRRGDTVVFVCSP
jgi:hypothetical protein